MTMFKYTMLSISILGAHYRFLSGFPLYLLVKCLTSQSFISVERLPRDILNPLGTILLPP